MNLINFFKQVFGIGEARIDSIIIKYGLNKKTNTLKKNKELVDTILKYIITNIKQKDVILKDLDIQKKKLVDNQSYKGYRIIRGLPLNKQRTKTNSRTIRRSK